MPVFLRFLLVPGQSRKAFSSLNTPKAACYIRISKICSSITLQGGGPTILWREIVPQTTLEGVADKTPAEISVEVDDAEGTTDQCALTWTAGPCRFVCLDPTLNNRPEKSRRPKTRRGPVGCKANVGCSGFGLVVRVRKDQWEFRDCYAELS